MIIIYVDAAYGYSHSFDEFNYCAYKNCRFSHHSADLRDAKKSR